MQMQKHMLHKWMAITNETPSFYHKLILPMLTTKLTNV